MISLALIVKENSFNFRISTVDVSATLACVAVTREFGFGNGIACSQTAHSGDVLRKQLGP